ncbi:hypothetical protein KR054_003843, partial [Drosophila jambulina]
INTCELYPRRRPTEFYRTPEPRVSIQSVMAEHPRDKLNAGDVQQELSVPQLPRIQPPRNSAMAFTRNSYFS